MSTQNVPHFYLYIDGASFTNSCNYYHEKISDGSLSFLQIDWAKLATEYHRVFFYNALPARGEKREEAQKFHEELATINDFHVREGVLQKTDRKGQKQKGVDILLAIEALKTALKGDVDQIHLMTSDLDFYPLLQSLTETRVKSHLYYDPTVTNSQLVRAADRATPISAELVLKFSNSIFPIKDYLPEEVGFPTTTLTKARSILTANAVNDFQQSFTIEEEPYDVFHDKSSGFYYVSKEYSDYCVRSKSYWVALEAAGRNHGCTPGSVTAHEFPVAVELYIKGNINSQKAINLSCSDRNTGVTRQLRVQAESSTANGAIVRFPNSTEFNAIDWPQSKLSIGSKGSKQKYACKSVQTNGFRRHKIEFA